MTKRHKRILRWIIGVLSTPFILFLLLGIILYLPPVQRWAVNKVCAWAEEETSLHMQIGEVRLGFPIDLVMGDMIATDTDNDTILDCRALKLSIPVIPLFDGEADIDGFVLNDAKVNTKSLISDISVKGNLKRLVADSHGIRWSEEYVRLNRVILEDANMAVALSDTAAKDTTTSDTHWIIELDKATLKNAQVDFTMLEGDSAKHLKETLHVEAGISEASIKGGHFDTGKPHYSVKQILLKGADKGRGNWVKFAPYDVSCIDTRIDTLSYNEKGQLRCGIHNLSFNEAGGFCVDNLSGSVYLDDKRFEVPALNLRTPYSFINAGVGMDWEALNGDEDSKMTFTIDASIGKNDVRILSKQFVDNSIQDIIEKALPTTPTTIKARVRGNINNILIDHADIVIPSLATLSAKGFVRNAITDDRRGDINYTISTGNIQPTLRRLQLLPASINIPTNMQAKGNVEFNGDSYATKSTLTTCGGMAKIEASTNIALETYTATLNTSNFPLKAFIPSMPLSDFTGLVRAQGTGYDPTSKNSSLTAKANIRRFQYDVYPLDNTLLDATIKNGNVIGNFDICNRMAEACGSINANIANGYCADIQAQLGNFNPYVVGILADTISMGGDVSLHLATNEQLSDIKSQGNLTNINFTTRDSIVNACDIRYDIVTNSDTTHAKLSAGDLDLSIATAGDINALLERATKFYAVLQSQMDEYRIDQDVLKKELPSVNLKVKAGTKNPMMGLLKLQGYDLRSLEADINTNAEEGVNGWVKAGLFQMGSLQLDTIYGLISHDADGVKMKASVHNYRKSNPNRFEATINSYVMERGIGANVNFRDEQGDTGIDLGVKVEIEELGYRFSFYPHNPIIAYRNFSINSDNYIFLSNDSTIAANINLLADDGTGLKIYGHPTESGDNDITVSVNNINLGELSRVIPYMPSVKGMLSGDFHISDENDIISAMASVEVNEFFYEDTELGNIGIEAIYLPKEDDEHFADAFISYNGLEVLEAKGSYYNKGEGSFSGDIHLFEFPLQMLNAFLSGTDFALRGRTEGDFHAEGSLTSPRLDGALNFDSAHIYSDIYNVDFSLDDQPVIVENNLLQFSNYELHSTGTNPLVMNGTLDARNIENIKLNFKLNANDFELINAKRKKQSLVYGKVFSDFSGTLTGNFNKMVIKGQLDVLEGTNATYILKDTPITVEDELANLVTFTNFQDTTTVVATPKQQSSIDITLGININEAARFHCFLSENGSSYVDATGGGDLVLRLTEQGDTRLTGRYTIAKGVMKYELPVIPLKTFTIEEGSYVEFTGDILDPTLSISAHENIKSSITEDDVSRSVAFIAGVRISQSLEDMGLEFTLEAPEDLSVQNQLSGMTPAERGKAAVALLATGMYMTDTNMTSGFKASNALNAFLQSEIQNIAGSALKTVDLSFGIEDGTNSTGTSQMDYTFQFSKRFLGDKLSLVVGGKLSSGAEAQNSAQSFIDNVSVEYRLDKGATRYVRVFYDHSSRDALEGTLTKTGAGLVLRRKTNKLGELFIFKKK